MEKIAAAVDTIKYRLQHLPDTTLDFLGTTPKIRDEFCNSPLALQEERRPITVMSMQTSGMFRDAALVFAPFAEELSKETQEKIVAHEIGHELRALNYPVLPMTVGMIFKGLQAATIVSDIYRIYTRRPKKSDLTRRAFLKDAGIIAGGYVLTTAGVSKGANMLANKDEDSCDGFSDFLYPEHTIKQAYEEVLPLYVREVKAYINDKPSGLKTAMLLGIGLAYEFAGSHPSEEERFEKSDQRCARFQSNRKYWEGTAP